MVHLDQKTAWMHSPYLDASDAQNKEHLPTFGIVTLEDTTNFKHILRQTDANSIQHAVHAIGDKANDWILNQFADIRAKKTETGIGEAGWNMHSICRLSQLQDSPKKI